MSRTIFNPVWGDSVIGADDGSYWNDDIDGDMLSVGADTIRDRDDLEDVQFMAAFDAEMGDIEAEDDADDDLAVGADSYEVGSIFQRGNKRIKTIQDRIARLRSRLARAKRRGKRRRVRRFENRLRRAQQLIKKVGERVQRRRKRRQRRGRGGGGSPNRGTVANPTPRSKGNLPPSSAARPSAMEQIVDFIPSLPAEGKLVVLPLEFGDASYTKVTLKSSTKSAVTDTKTWQSDGIPYAELRLIGAIVEAQLYGTKAAGLAGVELTKFAPDGKVQALYGEQVSLFDPYGFAADGSTKPAATQVGFLRKIIIGLRDKGRIERTNKVSGTVKVFAPAQAVGDYTIQYSLGAICDVIDDPTAAESA